MQCPHCYNEIKEIRQIIREELMHLDPDVANSMLTQLTTRLGRSIRTQGTIRAYEVKTLPFITEAEPIEVVRDEY